MNEIDAQLRQYIDDELRSDSEDDAAQIGVSEDNRAALLFGTIDSYAEEWTAEDETKPQGRLRVSVK